MTPIVRAIGYGDLQVVRQQLIGYEAGEVSHIENVLEGELLRRSTTREEVSELTITQETSTSQVEERDLQSTTRNELSTEAQKEVQPANRLRQGSDDIGGIREVGRKQQIKLRPFCHRSSSEHAHADGQTAAGSAGEENLHARGGA